MNGDLGDYSHFGDGGDQTLMTLGPSIYYVSKKVGIFRVSLSKTVLTALCLTFE